MKLFKNWKGKKDVEVQMKELVKNVGDNAYIVKVIGDNIPLLPMEILIGIRQKINYEIKFRNKVNEGKIKIPQL